MFIDINFSPTKNELKKFSKGMAALCFLGVVLGAWLNKGSTVEWGLLLGFMALFLFIGSMRPVLLKPFYRLWMGISMILGLIIGPIILTATFLFIITPVSILSRMTGKRWLLKKKKETSYWVPLDQQDHKSFKRQF